MLTQVKCYVLALSWLVASNMACAGGFDLNLTGNAADVKPAKTEGALMLMGGGGVVDEAFRWFIQKAGGGDIVVLKVTDRKDALEDSYGAYLHGTVGGCDSVELLGFRNREAASDAKAVKIIENAEGIFLGGGKQYLYTDYFKGTPLGKALEAHVKAGKPLGGSSAGLAVLGQFIYTAKITARLNSEMAMANPFDKAITLEKDFLNLELMRGVITDTHFAQRGRLGRLIALTARMTAEYQAPGLLGIGVDEKLALCVEANGIGHLISALPESRAWLVIPQKAPEEFKEGEPLTFRDVKVISAGPQSLVNVLKRTVEKPVSESTMSVIAGKLTTNP